MLVACESAVSDLLKTEHAFDAKYTVSIFSGARLVEMEIVRDILDYRRAQTTAHVMGKALGVKRIVGRKREPHALHLAATSALHTPHLELEVDTHIGAEELAHLACPPVVTAHARTTTMAATCFLSAG